MEMLGSGKLVQLLVVALLATLALAGPQCGRLEEKLMYTTDQKTEPSEMPWVGLLMEDMDDHYQRTGCSVVIVNELHVLTTATCVKRFRTRSGDTKAVALLGIWDSNVSPGEELECNSLGFCTPGPVPRPVTKITVHPNFDKDTGDHNLAVLRLSEPVKWNNWIQPICMEGGSEPESLINRNLHFSGFNNDDSRKGKGMAMTVSKQKCRKLIADTESILPPEYQLCGFPLKRTKYFPGAPLMDVDVQRDVPQSFYLVALLVRNVVSNDDTTTQIYQDVRQARSWIMETTATK
ncbi:phenoloxidase-activating factor 3 [Drosophila kikkawai]|uniref:Phenoloxidase-activating factor 3 n=1 Tax=Drosophila kikkawai TaxID=30033 RepID=A0A6P4HP30_DROKI|nr:phenoloxidase-activating factor 3 [Drosophila kikkawai]